MTSCCAPEPAEPRGATAPGPAPTAGDPAGAAVPDLDLVALDAQVFTMGNDRTDVDPGDGEGPSHEVELDAFAIGRHAVSNELFGAFVDATGYVSEAERFGNSFVFGGLLPDDFPPTQAVVQAPWWRLVEGSDWRHPEGPHSDLAGRLDHPVVHLTWNDAQAFCAWSGTRLPTEAEWECAARGGRAGTPFPWGDELEPGGQHAMNVFQGTFPGQNSGADGWLGTAPVDAYEPNGYGLYNVTGNVWEWCQDRYSPTAYRESRRRNPTGPGRGERRVMRGGSYLCHASYCSRYRVDARNSSTVDSSTGHVGFRVVRSAA